MRRWVARDPARDDALDGNLLRGLVQARRADGILEIALHGGRRPLLAAATDVPVGTDVTIAIRPESIRLVETTDNRDIVDSANALAVSVTEVSFLGDHYEYGVAAGGIELIAQSQDHISALVLTAVIEPSACAVFSNTPPANPGDRHGDSGADAPVSNAMPAAMRP
jgi:ABC-type Fe3+/spermidine/putrescine transport system ATPase subunit